MTDYDKTREEIYRLKSADRKEMARLPFNIKAQILLKMQRANYAIGKAAGRNPKKPWQIPARKVSASHPIQMKEQSGYS